MPSVAVIGAGLVGCLAALGLSKKGYEVSLYELRDDPRKSSNKNLRSINLAVSARGINALKYVDEELAERVLSKVIPMHGRMIHINGREESQQYDIDGQAINSIDREYLNNILLNEAKRAGIEIHFNHKLVKLDLRSKQAILTFDKKTNPVTVDLVVGADGSFSKVRQELQKFVRMDYTQEYIDSAYIELSIAPNDVEDPEKRYKLDKNHLHIWPKHDFMLIALPNLDGSFTSTFFAPWKLVEGLDTDEKVVAFFEENFPDAVDLITKEKLVYAFNNHPKGKLLSLTCNTYHHKDNVVIIGDAAHAMVPFYGQGMNCGFEDVFVLLSTIDQTKDLEKSLKSYSENRHKDLLAINYLAKENYKEMSHKVTSKVFLLKKQLDFLLTYFLRDKWIPLYTMVSFRSDISYSRALNRSRKQDKILKYTELGIVAAASLGLARLYHAFTSK